MCIKFPEVEKALQTWKLGWFVTISLVCIIIAELETYFYNIIILNCLENLLKISTQIKEL
jgi:hypothetical protein